MLILFALLQLTWYNYLVVKKSWKLKRTIWRPLIVGFRL